MRSVINQVAETPCLGCEDGAFHTERINGVMSHYSHEDCQNTGRRWPTLSRPCRFIGDWEVLALGECRGRGRLMYGDGSSEPCPNCNEKGRVPDVTLEKILALPHMHGVSFNHGPYSMGPWFRRCTLWTVGLKKPGKVEEFIGESVNSPLEAACAALLEIL